MKVLLYCVSVGAIAANLLIPQKIVTYHACCYDASGALAAFSDCAPGASHKVTMHGTCCDPIEHQLRAAAPAPISATSKVPPAQPALAILAAFSAPESRGVASFIVPRPSCAGPPRTDILTLHSRYNI